MSDANAPVLVLKVEPPLGAAFEYRADSESVVIGRSSKADLVVADRYLSRRQARLYRTEAGWFVEDLGSRNPTLLNGKALSGPARLSGGDVIAMSEARIHVQQDDVVASAQPVQTPDHSSGAVFRPASTLIAAQEARDADYDNAPAQLKARTNRLRLLNGFYRSLAAPMQLEELFEIVLDRAFADLNPEEGVIVLRRPDGEFERAATRRLPGVPDDFLYSRSLVREVTEKGMAALVTDASADERFAASDSIQSSGIRSLVAAPLLDPDGCPGMIVLNSRAQKRRFSEEDMEELVSLAAAAAMRIRNIALAEEAAQRRVLEKELSLARQIQMALLPAHLPEIPGYELIASNIPNRAVSGDLYQAQLRAGGSECVMMLADVSGKGMAASLLTASLEALAAGPIEEGLSPKEIFSRLSRRLHARTSAERYATGFLGALEVASGTLRYSSAGHNPVLLLRANGDLETLGATGLPLGLLPMADYAEEERRLEPGDLVVIYTDGITEAAAPDGEEYGLARVVELCRRENAGGLASLVVALEAELDRFVAGTPYSDDRTYLLLRRLPS